ncbi:alkylmercury lyase [Staphylococcus aureus]|nr:alkylmercury lyase [Staphylococcus aureus]
MKNISEFSAQLDQTFDQGEAVSMEWLFRPLLKMLAEGDPVPVEDIAAETGSPSRKLSKSYRLYLVWNLMSRAVSSVMASHCSLPPIASRLMGSNYMHGAPLTHLCSQHSSAGRSTSLRLVTAPVSPSG